MQFRAVRRLRDFAYPLETSLTRFVNALFVLGSPWAPVLSPRLHALQDVIYTGATFGEAKPKFPFGQGARCD